MTPWQTRFLASGGATLVLLLALVGFTDARSIFHVGVVAIGAVALLPALLLLAFFATVAVLTLVAALSGGDVDAGAGDLAHAAASAPAGWMVRYYRSILAQRDPVILGAAAGLGVATLVCAGYVGLVIVPKETRTAEALLLARQAVEDARRRDGRFPEPGPGGELRLMGAAGAGQGAEQSVRLDGFGRPLRYELAGRGLVRQYRITSLGQDGRPSRDDLCVEGGSRLARWLAGVASVAELIDVLRPGSVPRSTSFAAVRAMRCRPDERVRDPDSPSLKER